MTNGVPPAPGQPAKASKPMPLAIKIIIGVAIVGGCGIPLLGIVAAIAIPAMVRARVAGNEVSAIGTMRAITAAQLTYASTCGHGLFARSLPVLAKAPTDGTGAAFLSPDLSRADRIQKAGYVITIDAPPPPTDIEKPCNGVGAQDVSQTFVATADPVGPTTGRRHFATTGNGIVYQSAEPITFGSDGTANSPASPVQ